MHTYAAYADIAEVYLLSMDFNKIIILLEMLERGANISLLCNYLR